MGSCHSCFLHQSFHIHLNKEKGRGPWSWRRYQSNCEEQLAETARMAPGGIYRKCEEPDHAEMESTIPGKADSFLLKYHTCVSGRRSLPILYAVNAVLVLLWIIIFAVTISKYSEMARKLEQLNDHQAVLTANGSRMEKQLEGLRSNHSILGSRLTEELKKLESQQETRGKEVSKHLANLDAAEERIQEDTFKLLEALHKMNDSACRVCPEGWLLNRGHCYHFQEKQNHWSLAKTLCEEQESSLVIIDDYEEQRFLTSHSKNNVLWIGLSDINTENTFVWVDRSPASYTYWNPRQPNNYGHGQDCVVMTTSGRWDDRECGSNADGWICEKAWKC
nr:PREDICTED: low affinity immunoglobulin epsilon Fc receptor [Anolis carolinensis]|eukprot:XP_008102424.1 PREDICTED: low affinity immunoglobulin epsilon Fc receptor [Anolis carolinensis]